MWGGSPNRHWRRRSEFTNGDSGRLGRQRNANLGALRIQEIEAQIGGGLIEEVIQVAEGELKLVDTMIESKV